MSGINRRLYPNCLGTIFVLKAKGQHLLKQLKKPVSGGEDQTNKLWRIYVAPAANSVQQCANFHDFVYTGQLICCHSYKLVLSALLLVVQNLYCLLQICSWLLISTQYEVVVVLYGICQLSKILQISAPLQVYCSRR